MRKQLGLLRLMALFSLGGERGEAMRAERLSAVELGKSWYRVQPAAIIYEEANVMDRTYVIEDRIEQNGCGARLLSVSGFIHDEKRLFVRDDSGNINNGADFEIPFSEVTRQWRFVPLTEGNE